MNASPERRSSRTTSQLPEGQRPQPMPFVVLFSSFVVSAAAAVATLVIVF